MSSRAALKPPNPSIRHGESQDRKERILSAALQAFSEHGFDGATTREIAHRADVNLGLIKYYFDGKENLWRASVERAFSELRSRFDAISTEAAEFGDRERARRLIRSFVEFIAHKPEFVRIMHDEGKHDGPRMRWLVDNHVRNFFADTRALMGATGALPANASEADAVSRHYMLTGALVLLFHQAEDCKYLTGLDPSDPVLVDAHVRTLEQLLLGPLNP